jgi:hypothetical protein
VTTAAAQSTPSARANSSASRAGQGKDARSSGPDPDLFDGGKFDKENRPETGMLGEFEMPGSNDPQDKSKVGGNPGQAGGQENSTPPKSSTSAGAAGAPSSPSASGGGESGSSGGSESAGGGSSGDKSGSGGAVGGALDQSKPMGQSGQAGGSGPAGKAEGVAASNLQGGSSSAAQNSAAQSSPSKNSAGKIGSAELRIETLPETDKDVIGREAAAGGTQGSNRPMPNGGSTGSTNQNKGVEKGKVMPKGL